MTTIYLHIGTHKTGTTSLQKFLFDNREKLLEKGYLYPLSGTSLKSDIEADADIETRYNHLALARQLNKDKGLFPVDSWADLKREINTIKPKNVLISSETFALNDKFVHNADTIALLKKMLEEYGTTKIVIYLRRQDEFLRSFYCQQVKRCIGDIGNIQKFILQYKYKINYYSMLEPWKKTFGSENIIVRPFEKKQLKNGCLISDFCAAINLVNINEDEFNFSNTIAQNISPSEKDVKLIRLISKIILINRALQVFCQMAIANKKPRWLRLAFFLSRKYRFLRIKLAIVISRFIPEFLISEELLSKEDRISIMEEFEESNRKVAQECLGREDGILFYSKP